MAKACILRFYRAFCSLFFLTTVWFATYGQDLDFFNELVARSSHCSSIEYGTLEVPLNHPHNQSTTLTIAYTVLKSSTKEKNAYPLLYLSGGGPGLPSIAKNSLVAWAQDPSLKNRDIILFDARGIGLSTELPNIGPTLFKLMANNSGIEEESNQFSKAISDFKSKNRLQDSYLSSFNSIETANDVGSLMVLLGYEKYHLLGKSYGTRLARIVQDKYPDKVASVVLDSPAPIDLNFLTSTIEATSYGLKELFKYCRNDKICSSKHPGLQHTFEQVLEQLKNAPIKIVSPDFQEGFFINPQDAIYFLRRSLFGHNSNDDTPKLIYALLNRDTELLQKIIANELQVFSTINVSLLLSVESYSRFDQGDFLSIQKKYSLEPLLKDKIGFFDSLYFEGKKWHSSRLKNRDQVFLISEIPTLILVNHYDAGTPPANGKKMLKKLKKGKLLVVNGAGHVIKPNECYFELLDGFYSDPTVPLKTNCLNLKS